MYFRDNVFPCVVIVLMKVSALRGDSSNSVELRYKKNVTTREYIPVKEYRGRHIYDKVKEDLYLPHKHIVVKRAAVKRKHKDLETTKKRLPRTTKAKTSRVWIIRTTQTTTIKPLKYNESLRKCQRRKLMNIAVGNDKYKLEDWYSKEADRQMYKEIMKPYNVIGGPKNPNRKIKKRLNRVKKLNFTQVLFSTYSGFNYTTSLLEFKKQRPSYLVQWNVSSFQIYNTSIQTKNLHQGRLSLQETAMNPNLTVFDLWWNDTERNLDTNIRWISLNRSYTYRIKYPRRQDREHRPTFLEKKKARLSLLKYYIGTTPGEIVPTRYLNKNAIRGRATPIKILSKKLLAKQKKERLKRVNKERRRRRVLRKKGFKVTNIPTPSTTVKYTKIRRQDPALRANLSFFDRDMDYQAFYDLSKMVASEFEQHYDIVEVSTRQGLHRKQKTKATTEFYDEASPTTEKTTVTMKRSKQKLGVEKRLKEMRGGAQDSKQERFEREMKREGKL